MSTERQMEATMPFAENLWDASVFGERHMIVDGKHDGASKASISTWYVKEMHITQMMSEERGGDADPLMSCDGIDEDDLVDSRIEPGWYYAFCQPGCLLDTSPLGPFERLSEALSDAVYNETGWAEEFTEYDEA